MNPRERILAVVLMVFIFLVIGGFVGYTFLYSPIKERNQTLMNLQAEIDKKNTQIGFIEAEMPRFERLKKMSLPADVDLARLEYERQLSGLLRKSDFQGTSITITARQADTKTAPTLTGKKPAYTKLQFQVQVKGELLSLVDFLELFYAQPLLHQIRNINVTKMSSTGTNRNRDRQELDINMTIEALVLDKAENRVTLAHVPSAFALVASTPATIRYGVQAVGKGVPYQFEPVLAEPKRIYASIAGKNIFFGPPRPAPKIEIEETPREPDISRHIKLTSIANSDGKISASLYDVYNNHDYAIEQAADGSYVVEIFYKLNNTKKRYSKSKDIEWGDEAGGNFKRYRIIQMTESELILQDGTEDRDKKLRGPSLVAGGSLPLLLPGRLYSLHVGDRMSELKPLLTREARQKMLEAKPKQEMPAKGRKEL